MYFSPDLLALCCLSVIHFKQALTPLDVSPTWVVCPLAVTNGTVGDLEISVGRTATSVVSVFHIFDSMCEIHLVGGVVDRVSSFHYSCVHG